MDKSLIVEAPRGKRSILPSLLLLSILGLGASCEDPVPSSGDPGPADTLDARLLEVPGDIPVADLIPDTETPDSITQCPAEPPLGLSGACPDNQRCEYGQECCCGTCHPSLVCTCSGGRWACYNTDACMIPGCPDAVDDPGPDSDADPDVPVPTGCCSTDEQCGEGLVCGGTGYSSECKPRPERGRCYRDEHCYETQTCEGARVCGCDADCDWPDTEGTCEPLPVDCCNRDDDCGDGFVCRGMWDHDLLPGRCVPAPEGPECPGDSQCCWNDNDCTLGTCHGAIVCGCIELCWVCGACMADQMGSCDPPQGD
jgi:hypothetical protein